MYSSQNFYNSVYRPIYMTENCWHGSDKIGTRTKNIAPMSCLHVFYSAVLSDVR